MTLRAVPISLAQAGAFIVQHHRHHKPPQGGKFAIGAAVGERLVGVVIAGRPTSRKEDGKLFGGFHYIGEITRMATDGTPNACSFLYARARRAMQQMGYTHFSTFLLDHEAGGSVVADGWKLVSVTTGGSWNSPTRPRLDKSPTCPKRKFVRSIYAMEASK